MEYNGGIPPTLLAIRASEESAHILKATLCLLKCFFLLDVCYLLAGISMIVMAHSNHTSNNDLVLCGGLFGLFAAMSAMCNSLARHGVRVWRRELIIPWLLFYPWVLGFLVIHLMHNLSTTNFHLELHQVLVFIGIFSIFSCWRQMNRQFTIMASARPTPVIQNKTQIQNCSL